MGGVGDETSNKIPFPYTSVSGNENNGITEVINDDGSITFTGTSTGTNIIFDFCGKNNSYRTEIGKKYVLYAESSVSKPEMYRLVVSYRDADYQALSDGIFVYDGISPKIFTYGGDYKHLMMYIIPFAVGVTFDKFTIKPMLIDVDDNNLLEYPYANTTKTVNGITFTDNGDGTITVNGTATNTVSFYCITTDDNVHYDGKILCCGCPSGGDKTKYNISLSLYGEDDSGYIYVQGISDIGSGAMIDCSLYNYRVIEYKITIQNGMECNNLVFEPKLVALKYEHPGVTIPLKHYTPEYGEKYINIFAGSPLIDGESLSLSREELRKIKLAENNIFTAKTKVKPESTECSYYTY